MLRLARKGDLFRMPPVVVSPSLVGTPPWTWPWWRPAAGQQMTLLWIMLIHVTAAVAVAGRTGGARALLSGSQRGVLSRLDCSPGPAARHLVLRRLSVRHRGLLLAWGYSAGLCSPWAVFCQQRVPFTSGLPARGRF